MRNFFLLAIAILLVACSKTELLDDLPSPESGIVINGVRWATRNVAAPGTFAQNPEDAGMFFQWNRKIGWIYNDGEVKNSDGATTWNRGNPAGVEWAEDNNPCPRGWRVPTEAELISLRNAGGSWRTLNGVRGRLFGTPTNGIFLPAAGWLDQGTGYHHDESTLGLYWSCTQSGNNRARNMTFSSRLVGGMRSNARASGHSIRCVAD